MTRTQRTGRGVDGRPGRRYEVTDDGYARIADLLPTQHRSGKWNDHRIVLNGIFWVLNSGVQWPDMPDHYGQCETIYGRYRRWVREGLFDRILHRLHVSLEAYGRIDWSVFDVDGSNVRAHRVAGGAAKASTKTDRTSQATTPWDDPAEGRRGDLHLVTDGASIPLAALFDAVRIGRRSRQLAVAGDKGYRDPGVRTWLAERGLEMVIPRRSNQRPPMLDRRRNVVERCIGWLKECRRVVTRYEKLAVHFLAMVKLAMIQRCLRLLDPSNIA